MQHNPAIIDSIGGQIEHIYSQGLGLSRVDAAQLIVEALNRNGFVILPGKILENFPDTTEVIDVVEFVKRYE